MHIRLDSQRERQDNLWTKLAVMCWGGHIYMFRDFSISVLLTVVNTHLIDGWISAYTFLEEWDKYMDKRERV